MRITQETAARLFKAEHGISFNHEDDQADLLEFGKNQLEDVSRTMKALSGAIGGRKTDNSSNIRDADIDSMMSLLSGQADMVHAVLGILLEKQGQS